MTEPHISRHHEMVKHLHRHTELRRKAAEEAVREALGETEEEEQDGDEKAGG